MNHITVIRNENDIDNIILSEEHKSNFRKMFVNFRQIAYCVESGDIVAVIDKDGYLQVNIPGYESI